MINEFFLLLRYGSDFPSGCPICLEEIQRDEVIRILPCHHIFHKRCLDVWFMQKQTCPVCRRDPWVAASEIHELLAEIGVEDISPVIDFDNENNGRILVDNEGNPIRN